MLENVKPILNATQLSAFDAIEHTNSNLLILGPAGTGKSTFVNYLKSENIDTIDLFIVTNH